MSEFSQEIIKQVDRAVMPVIEVNGAGVEQTAQDFSNILSNR